MFELYTIYECRIAFLAAGAGEIILCRFLAVGRRCKICIINVFQSVAMDVSAAGIITVCIVLTALVTETIVVCITVLADFITASARSKQDKKR